MKEEGWQEQPSAVPSGFNQSPHVLHQIIEVKLIFTCPRPEHINKIHKFTPSITCTTNRNNYRMLLKECVLVKYKPTCPLNKAGGKLNNLDMHSQNHTLD
jgi:hypothetical protein